MSDGGFDFKTPERRETKRFEAPPWEREAFETLRKQLDEQQPEPDPVPEMAPAADAPVADEAPPAGAPPKVVGERPPPPLAPEEPKVIEMLAELSAQEPRMRDTTWRLEIGSALVGVAVGVALVVWGIAGLAKAGGTSGLGLALASLLLVAGAGFAGAAGWYGVRTLRQRGVL